MNEINIQNAIADGLAATGKIDVRVDETGLVIKTEDNSAFHITVEKLKW